MPVIEAKLRRLERGLRDAGGVVVALSGGVDSALVAAVAARVLGERALAVTAVSPSLPPGELAEARDFARSVGIRHRTVRTGEIDDPRYAANGLQRCYHCKSELYDVLARVARDEGLPRVASGTNADDLGDYRPGLRAAGERAVLQPLADAGFTKADVREAARRLGLRVWDKPASACLSSRFPFGVRITVEGLSRVGRAERALKELGLRQLRVRDHGDVARVEVEVEELGRLADADFRRRCVDAVKAAGYRFVALDLEGFRSGSMNPEPSAG